MASLEAGFSREIFVEWATDNKNIVLFTERGQVCSWIGYWKSDLGFNLLMHTMLFEGPACARLRK